MAIAKADCVKHEGCSQDSRKRTEEADNRLWRSRIMTNARNVALKECARPTKNSVWWTVKPSLLKRDGVRLAFIGAYPIKTTSKVWRCRLIMSMQPICRDVEHPEPLKT